MLVALVKGALKRSEPAGKRLVVLRLVELLTDGQIEEEETDGDEGKNNQYFDRHIDHYMMELMKIKRIPERRKRYGWLVFLTLITWLGLAAIILWVDPENVRDLVIPGTYLLFSAPAGLAVFLLLTIVFLSTKRALWWTLAILVSFYLRIYGLGSALNGGMILGIFVCGEVYVRMKKMGYTHKHASINEEAK